MRTTALSAIRINTRGALKTGPLPRILYQNLDIGIRRKGTLFAASAGKCAAHGQCQGKCFKNNVKGTRSANRRCIPSSNKIQPGKPSPPLAVLTFGTATLANAMGDSCQSVLNYGVVTLLPYQVTRERNRRSAPSMRATVVWCAQARDAASC